MGDGNAILRTLEDLAMYYEVNRQVGHTRVLREGLDHYPDRVAVLVSSHEDTRLFAGNERVVPVTLSHLDPIRVWRLPLVIDNHAAWSLFRGAAREIQTQAHEIRELRKELAEERVKGHA